MSVIVPTPIKKKNQTHTEREMRSLRDNRSKILLNSTSLGWKIRTILLTVLFLFSFVSDGFRYSLYPVCSFTTTTSTISSRAILSSSLLSPSSIAQSQLHQNHRWNLLPLEATRSRTQTITTPQDLTSTVLEVEADGQLSELIFRNFQDIQFGEIKKIGIIGTRQLSKNHQQMIELLSYALVLSGNHVITSGGGTTNSTNHAVIRGALRACNPDLLTVILPQSLSRQSEEMQNLLSSVTHVVESPENDRLELKEAANLCNYQIFGLVEKIIVFAYHHSFTILNSIKDFEKTIETIKFFLD